MVSLALHISAFFLLFPTGLNRLISSTSLFLHNPAIFLSKPWFFSNQLNFHLNHPNNINNLSCLKNLDLFTLLISLPLSSFSHLFLFLSLPTAHSPTYRFSFLLYSTSLFLFWGIVVLILVKDYFLNDSLGLVNEGYLFFLAGVCFLVEYWMVGRGMSGVGEEVYVFLGWLSLVCGGCCLILCVKPSGFFAEYGLCCGLMVKGSWGLQVGLSMGSDGGWFVWKGCERVGVVGVGELDVGLKCGVEEDALRGLALMRFLFVWHVIGVLVGSFVLFSVLSTKQSSRFGDVSGPLLLAQGGAEGAGLRVVPEFELE